VAEWLPSTPKVLGSTLSAEKRKRNFLPGAHQCTKKLRDVVIGQDKKRKVVSCVGVFPHKYSHTCMFLEKSRSHGNHG
jgi:ATP-dependent protease Clp ATPase subunit